MSPVILISWVHLPTMELNVFFYSIFLKYVIAQSLPKIAMLSIINGETKILVEDTSGCDRSIFSKSDKVNR